MIRLLIISFLLLLSCKENIKTSNFEVNKVSDKTISSEEKINKDWFGKWIYTKKNENSDIPELQFTLTIIQNGQHINAQYCAIANSGGKIDCENEKEYNITGEIINDKIIGNFYSFFGSSKDKGKVEISFIDNNTINWKIISSPKGLFYAPDNCNLNRKDATNISSIKDKAILPLKNSNVEDLKWEESQKFINYNLTYNLPKYKNFSVVLAKNDMGDDVFYTVFTLNGNNQMVDSLKISYVEDGYPENDKRQITEFIINPDYHITLNKFEKKDYDKIPLESFRYNISDAGKFVKTTN